jgi:hypothetical protein
MPAQVSADAGHFLVTNARDSAFTAYTRLILARLGYTIVNGEELARASGDGTPRPPELVIADENHLDELSELIDDPAVPVILITGRRGIREERPNIIAAVKRPAGLHDLYRILQQHFEETPRSAPRVATNLEARCSHDGRSWAAYVLSLSENGCLLRSAQPIPLGCTFNLTLNLPVIGALEIQAETAYQLVPDLGLVFSAVPPRIRASLESYVNQALAPA